MLWHVHRILQRMKQLNIHVQMYIQTMFKKNYNFILDAMKKGTNSVIFNDASLNSDFGLFSLHLSPYHIMVVVQSCSRFSEE